MDSMTLTRAIILWTGWGRTAWPTRDESLLVKEFGPVEASRVLPEIRRLEDDFYSSDASRVAPDLVSMGRQAASEFRSAHPEIGEEAVQAFAWSYTFDFR